MTAGSVVGQGALGSTPGVDGVKPKLVPEIWRNRPGAHAAPCAATSTRLPVVRVRLGGVLDCGIRGRTAIRAMTFRPCSEHVSPVIRPTQDTPVATQCQNDVAPHKTTPTTIEKKDQLERSPTDQTHVKRVMLPALSR